MTRPSLAPDWLAAGLPHIWLPYTQMATAAPPLAVVSTNGVRLRLADGRELIDGISSWWTACHGYNHPHIREALERQVATLPHVMFAGLVHEPALRLAQRLAALLPGDLDRVFFTESGSVAVEVALKMAMQYWRNRGKAERQRFVFFRHGYHGDTFATMALCDPDEGMHTLFSAAMPEQLMAELRTRYQAVIFDSPPLGAGVDPLILASLTGSLVLVLRNGVTDRAFAGARLDALQKLPIRVLGAILNDVRASEGMYRYYSYIPGYRSEDEVESEEQMQRRITAGNRK